MIKTLTFVTLLFATLLVTPVARAFEHPGLPLTRADLDDTKARIQAGQEPWASVYAGMATYVNPNYVMAGPFETVSRTPNINNGAWKGDMGAIYDLSRMWYFSGNTAYAQKARDVLIAWATTHKTFGGAEGFMDMGDYSYRLFGAADILRGTWPGWTQEDTDICKGYFLDVYWWAAGVPGPLRSANQGAMQLPIGLGVAVFCDDQGKFDLCLQAFRADAAGGLAGTLSNGEMGDTGRDQGHAYGQLQHLTWIAEVFWKHGVDVYREQNNRLLHAGEYFARYNLGVNTPFIPFGTTYDLYPGINGAGYFNGLDMMNMLHSAYQVRMGMSTPYIDQYRARMGEGADSMVFLKTADTSTAISPAPLMVAPTDSVTTGLTSVDIGGTTPAGGSNYSAGFWTLNGAGPTITYGASDACRFAYLPRTGDCTIIAKVASSPSSRAGVMIRESLAANSSMMACYVDGTQIWAALRGYTASSHGGGVQIHDFVSVPYWVKLERVGKRITAFHSPDGASWTEIQIGDYNTMDDSTYVGLCQASYTGGTPNTATFSDVRITGGDSGEAAKIPAAPFAVYGSPGNHQVPLRWLESFGATSYHVKRSITSGGPYTTIATVSGSSHEDLTVTNGTTYYYVVSAVNPAGESPDTAEDPVTLPLQLAINASGGTATASAERLPAESAAKAFDGDFSTKWFNNNLGTTGRLRYDLGAGNARVVRRYDLTSANDVAGRDPKDWQLQGSNDGSIWDILDTQAGVTFTGRYQTKQFPLANTTAYRYFRLFITANNGDALGLQLAELALRSATATLPATPAAPAASAESQEQISISWAAVSGAENYHVQRATSPGGPYTRIASPEGTRFIDSGLALLTTCYYVITAVNAAGESAGSTPVSATTQTLPAPAKPTVVPGVQHLSIFWSVVGQATGYALKRSTTAGGPYTPLATLAATSFIDATATDGVTYYYVVSARRDAIEGADSAEAGATRLSLTPLAHVSFNEVGGTSAADATGNGWNASLVNNPGRAAGRSGNAVALNGTNQYASLPTGVVNGLTDFTISAWVNVPSIATWQRVFDFGTRTTNYMFLTTRHTNNNGTLRFGIRTTASAAEEVITASIAMPAGVWKHVAVTLSGSTGTIYVNGVAVGQNTAMTLTPASLGITTRNYLGKSQFNDPYLAGMVDEFQIHNRALTSGEIDALAHPPVVPAPPSGLLAASASASSIHLNWAAASGAASYQLKRSTLVGGPYVPVTGVSSTGFSDTGLSNGTTYYYVVSSANAAGESTLSNEASATPLSIYQQWKLGNNIALATPSTATPDGDGIALLLKYATGLTPGSPAVGPVVLASANPGLSIQFNRVRPADVDYVVEASADCAGWTPIATLATGSGTWTGSATVSESGTGSLRVSTVTDTGAPAISRFLRLRVVGASP